LHAESCGVIAYDVVTAKGHPNVSAKHRTTFEVTTEPSLTPRGDCIIGVSADKSAADLSPQLKSALRSPRTLLLVLLIAGSSYDIVEAWGDERLTLTDTRRIVVRRSSYVRPETLAVNANKAARDLKRELVAELKDPSTTLKVFLLAVQCTLRSKQ
jgi:hypothetical protein